MDKFTRGDQYHELVEEELLVLRQLSVQNLKDTYHRFSILDEVFVETNQHWGEKWSWKKILEYDSNIKANFRYWYAKIPYRASIFTMNDVEGLWLSIKLTNNGFVYFPKPGTPITRHGHNRWVALRAKDYIKYFPNMLQVVDSEAWKWQTIAIFYNAFTQRLDIKLRGSGGVNLLISYEPGFPFEEEEHHYEKRADLIQH